MPSIAYTLFASALLCTSGVALAQTPKEIHVTQHAKGEFEVKIAPISGPDEALGRMSLDKIFHGDLDATSTGQMMANRDESTGTAVYVAIETVTGTLAGHKGSFMLAHRGMMNKGGQELSVVVVPASGTGALAGLTGDLDIIIEGGKHFYEFSYTLPAPQ